MRRVGLALAVSLAATAPVAAAPARVVSLNLCTDQLALLVAAPGQLVSVSRYAADPAASSLPEAGAAIPANNGTAEQVFLLEPDLVLASTFSDPQTIALLRRLGVRVELLEPATSLAGVAGDLRRVGALLGQEAAAEAVVAEYEAELARLSAAGAALPRERAAYVYANSFTAGSGTLEGELLDRAGFDNAAGVSGSARMPLERLVLEAPFLVTTHDIAGNAPALAYAALANPALGAAGDGRRARVEERWQVCGTPFVTRTIDALIAARPAQPPQPE